MDKVEIKWISLHLFLLTNAVASILRLPVHLWIPVAVKKDDDIGGCQVDP
tara:strand:+ start:522 stop:671 length:150 start_codon:yes stop_codon:yes gene_type:complete